ncbi:hypothetical protein [Nocardia sp. NPDC049526]|uniref:hypothetical protein n=1 Tax=Nocardia sp. NPDC049526 TaxID=3364316 RepID=UPI0037B4F808
MPCSETARANHEALFPGHVSTWQVTDPELIEVFDNFAFDEVWRHSDLDLRTRLMTQLAALIASHAVTEFRYGSARIAHPLPAYDNNPAHAFQAMLDPANGLAPGDPARMATAIIESTDTDPAPLCIVLGSGAFTSTIDTLHNRIAALEAQTDLAASTDYPLPIATHRSDGSST